MPGLSSLAERLSYLARMAGIPKFLHSGFLQALTCSDRSWAPGKAKSTPAGTRGGVLEGGNEAAGSEIDMKNAS
jgi:hypothetical protein